MGIEMAQVGIVMGSDSDMINRHIFRMRIAGIPHRKMRTCLFRDQNRKLILYPKFPRCHKCRSIGAAE